MRVGAWIASTAVTLLLVSGCQDDESEADGPSPTPAATTAAPSEATPSDAAPSDAGSSDAAPEGELQPCALLSAEDLSTAYARPMLQDGVGGGASDEGGVQWKYETCTWEQDGEEGLDVTLAVSDASDFSDGVLTCPVLDYLGEPATEVPGLSVPASWLRTSTNDLEGTLQLCTDTHVFAIDVELPTGTDADLAAVQEQSTVLAGALLQAAGA